MKFQQESQFEKNLEIIMVAIIFILYISTIIFYPKLSGEKKPYYKEGETLDPNCSPTDPLCTVR